MLLSSIANASPVRTYFANNLNPAQKSTPVHFVKFGNNKAYYRELDPKLTEDQIHAYSEAEKAWRGIIRNVETNQGNNIFGIIRPKTHHEYRALIHALNHFHPQIAVDENLPEDAAADNFGAHPSAYTNRRGDGKIMIHTYVDIHNPAMANTNFLTAAHEGLHAVHILTAGSIEPARDESIVSELDAIEKTINHAVHDNRVPHNQQGWKQLFRNQPGLLESLRGAYDIDDLKKIKPDLISEAAAYKMSSYIGETPEDVQQELDHEAGYRAAISLINDLINEKNTAIIPPRRSASESSHNHAGSSSNMGGNGAESLSPPRGEWRYTDNKSQKHYFYFDTAQWSAAEPTRADSPTGWKPSLDRTRWHYKHPDGQRTDWQLFNPQ